MTDAADDFSPMEVRPTPAQAKKAAAEAKKAAAEKKAEDDKRRNDRALFEEQQFLNAFRQIKEIKTNIALEMGDAKEIYSRLKNIGFTKGDIKWAMELEEKDSGDIIATMQRRIRIAKMLGHGLARQLDLLETDRTPLVDRAYEEGLAAGKLRKEPTCPYDLGSEPGQAYMRGYHDGQAFANADLSAAMSEVDDPAFPEAAE